MGCWRVVRAVLAATVIASLAGGGAARAEVALGASFGYTHISYPDEHGFSNDVVGIPGSAEWGQPAIRVGYLAPGGMWDLNADIGFASRASNPDYHESSLQVLPQVQVNIPVQGRFHPFVNAGVGLSRVSTALWATETITGTRPVFGVGAGVRRSVSDHHGLMRLELRYDHLQEWKKRIDTFTTLTRLASDQLSVKLGFDLLLSH
jgi:opacity protein-like surface antigen